MAFVNMTRLATIRKSMRSSRMNMSSPRLPLAMNSSYREPGSEEMIPIMMSMEMPLPRPLSVILSPIHVQAMVPAGMIASDAIKKRSLLVIITSSGTATVR